MGQQLVSWGAEMQASLAAGASVNVQHEYLACSLVDRASAILNGRAPAARTGIADAGAPHVERARTFNERLCASRKDCRLATDALFAARRDASSLAVLQQLELERRKLQWIARKLGDLVSRGRARADVARLEQKRSVDPYGMHRDLQHIADAGTGDAGKPNPERCYENYRDLFTETRAWSPDRISAQCADAIYVERTAGAGNRLISKV